MRTYFSLLPLQPKFFEMKKNLLLLSFLFCSIMAQAQNDEHRWAVGANIGAFDYFTPINRKPFNADEWKFNP